MLAGLAYTAARVALVLTYLWLDCAQSSCLFLLDLR
jgi:hypothetical protein